MWVRGAAIRPVPPYAVVNARVLEEVERDLADDTERARGDLDDAFARFERTQPELADRVSHVLSKRLDETALALGYFLSIAVWLSFERAFSPARLREVTADELRATEDALTLEEELRAANGREPFDLDDVVSLEQPGILEFVHDHVDAALDISARRAVGGGEGGGGEGDRDVDVDDVHQVYRTVLVLTLALSHAVLPINGVRGNAEMMA